MYYCHGTASKIFDLRHSLLPYDTDCSPTTQFAHLQHSLLPLTTPRQILLPYDTVPDFAPLRHCARFCSPTTLRQILLPYDTAPDFAPLRHRISPTTPHLPYDTASPLRHRVSPTTPLRHRDTASSLFWHMYLPHLAKFCYPTYHIEPNFSTLLKTLSQILLHA
jgi:hypothetical protein